MITFNQQITPAMQEHIEAQASLFTDVYKKSFSAIQQINDLNTQMAQRVLEESVGKGNQILTAKDPYEAWVIAMSQVQPNVEDLRSYRQQVSNIMAGIQVELAETAKSHVSEATRTATALVEETARLAHEETEKAAGRQKASMDKLLTAQQGRSGNGEHASKHK